MTKKSEALTPKPRTGARRRARQEGDKQALQALILETARKEFANSSLEAVSIQKIADAAGYSKATVLKYFPSKILLLLAVKQINLEEVAAKLDAVYRRDLDAEGRLREILEAYLTYWLKNPDNFRSLYSMAGTREDRRFPDGRYFGETEIAKRSFEIFCRAVDDYLAGKGVRASSALSVRLASALLSAAHGVIALPLGTPSMKWPDVKMNGRLVVGGMIDAWNTRLDLARIKPSWPAISLQDFL